MRYSKTVSTSPEPFPLDIDPVDQEPPEYLTIQSPADKLLDLFESGNLGVRNERDTRHGQVRAHSGIGPTLSKIGTDIFVPVVWISPEIKYASYSSQKPSAGLFFKVDETTFSGGKAKDFGTDGMFSLAKKPGFSALSPVQKLQAFQASANVPGTISLTFQEWIEKNEELEFRISNPSENRSSKFFLKNFYKTRESCPKTDKELNNEIKRLESLDQDFSTTQCLKALKKLIKMSDSKRMRYLERAFFEKETPSEKYQGKVLRHNECLLLLQDKSDIVGVFTSLSSKSVLDHALAIQSEMETLTGVKLPLAVYSPKDKKIAVVTEADVQDFFKVLHEALTWPSQESVESAVATLCGPGKPLENVPSLVRDELLRTFIFNKILFSNNEDTKEFFRDKFKDDYEENVVAMLNVVTANYSPKFTPEVVAKTFSLCTDCLHSQDSWTREQMALVFNYFCDRTPPPPGLVQNEAFIAALSKNMIEGSTYSKRMLFRGFTILTQDPTALKVLARDKEFVQMLMLTLQKGSADDANSALQIVLKILDLNAPEDAAIRSYVMNKMVSDVIPDLILQANDSSVTILQKRDVLTTLDRLYVTQFCANLVNNVAFIGTIEASLQSEDPKLQAAGIKLLNNVLSTTGILTYPSLESTLVGLHRHGDPEMKVRAASALFHLFPSQARNEHFATDTRLRDAIDFLLEGTDSYATSMALNFIANFGAVNPRFLEQYATDPARVKLILSAAISTERDINWLIPNPALSSLTSKGAKKMFLANTHDFLWVMTRLLRKNMNAGKWDFVIDRLAVLLNDKSCMKAIEAHEDRVLALMGALVANHSTSEFTNKDAVSRVIQKMLSSASIRDMLKTKKPELLLKAQEITKRNP